MLCQQLLHRKEQEKKSSNGKITTPASKKGGEWKNYAEFIGIELY